ncbi:MAG: CotH kinase family protein [Microbacteriaceae bacterium]|nr:CotH kinase family protein [Microbacteriaceae bacterium]
MTKPTRPAARAIASLAGLGLIAATLAGCTTATTTSPSTTTTSVENTVATTTASLWDSTTVHTIAVTVDPTELDTLVSTYLSTGEKVWVSATVVIDGVAFENVGIKLKGNSSLRTISSGDDPATMPWIIRLDKFVDGQNYEGETQLVVRANSTETALNEAVALELLSAAGLASEEAVASRFTVNGGDTQLRLVIQNPDDDWDADAFGTEGLLYKAESGGDYTYRGEDPASYTDIFEQEAGDDNLQPLIDFLKFINESDDATFAADLSQYLDVNAFATYLAYQDLVDNFDDIDGPGNNSYLHYDEATGVMTVVNWDLNLAFGTANVDGGGQPGAGGQPGQVGGARPNGGGAGGAGGPSSGNVLSERFLANSDFAALVTSAKTTLTETLYTSGTADQILDEWVTVLKGQASDLVSASTVESEAAAVRSYFSAS